MKYRALLIDPGLDRERPVQIYGKDRTLLESWANNIPAQAEVDRLLQSQQLRLLETRQDVLGREARAGRRNRERMTRAAEQREQHNAER